MKKATYQSPSVAVTVFTAEGGILQYSGLNDMPNNPGSGWQENLDNDYIPII